MNYTQFLNQKLTSTYWNPYISQNNVFKYFLEKKYYDFKKSGIIVPQKSVEDKHSAFGVNGGRYKTAVFQSFIFC